MRPSEDRIQLWPLFILAVVIVVLMLSVEFKFRLNESVPLEFARVPSSVERSRNADLAQGYWRTAVQVIQYKYPRGTPLPPDPPVEFSLPPEYQHVHNTGSQREYWNELRRAWENPGVWHRTVSVDAKWPLRAAQDVSRVVSGIF